MARTHTDRDYENELRRLREQLLLMGAKVEEMLAGAMRALLQRDSELARRMMDLDLQINRLEVDTDEQCQRILARRQPVASDLRFITIALKLVTDLERIGDLGVNICERVVELNEEPPLGVYEAIPGPSLTAEVRAARGASPQPYPVVRQGLATKPGEADRPSGDGSGIASQTLQPHHDLARMAETAQAMVREALDAFVAGDAERAQRVIDRDRLVDHDYAQIFRELVTYMLSDPRAINRAIRIQSIAKYLERIGDHATNLAEMVVFMVKGKDIRHLGRLEEPRQKRLPHGVLFLCVQNTARSQMAEGWAQKLLPAGVRVWSAGSRPAAAMNPYAVKVMQEVGIDISGQSPKGIADVPLGDVDLVVTLCAEEVCPVLPAPVSREAWPLPDPAAVRGSEEEILAAFRAARDELRRRIEGMK